MAIGIRLHSDTSVQARGVVLQIRAQKVRIDGVRDVGADQEAVGVHLRHDICAALAVVGEGFADALESAGKEVAVGALAQQGADLFVVEAADYFYGAAGIGGGGFRGGDEGFDGGEGAEFVVDAAGEDEFFGEAAELCRLRVEELELPI